jgi:hypothetical protein
LAGLAPLAVAIFYKLILYWFSAKVVLSESIMAGYHNLAPGSNIWVVFRYDGAFFRAKGGEKGFSGKVVGFVERNSISIFF